MKKTPNRRMIIWVLVFFAFFLAALLMSNSGNFPAQVFCKKDKPALKLSNNKYISQIVKYFPFSVENSLKEWEEKVLKGKVIYVIEKG